ncbi:MAG TPA: hypothetical protein PL155_06815 [Candidatus Omnitrophota bacterium]|nr:hypothetical protein [Candidatus Omnitrophota bacterium]HPD85580.1 hypothetical protein [Candidatus Omnitrophota bacterium]HRZ04380.1 hypothetical protein [Candidatus Omnitrophota bacterium]
MSRLKNTLSFRINKKLIPCTFDRRALAEIKTNVAPKGNDLHDFSRAVVRKPWGYEYLLFANKFVSAWILNIKKGCRTSMHCHQGKKTSIIVLSGNALCLTLGEKMQRRPAQGVLFGKGVFHSTRSLSSRGTFILEIETPVNKRDLVRLKDDYGREQTGYETDEYIYSDLQQYDYVSFIDSNSHFDTQKRFGRCRIQFMRYNNHQSLKDLSRRFRWDMMCILKGRIIDGQGKVVFKAGNVLGREDIKESSGVRTSGVLEAIVVRKDR